MKILDKIPNKITTEYIFGLKIIYWAFFIEIYVKTYSAVQVWEFNNQSILKDY